MKANALYGFRLTLILFLFLTNNWVCNSQSQSSGDAKQISSLIAGLADHSIKPPDVLDPTLSSKERATNLEFFDASSYELSIVPTGEVEFKHDSSATLPVTVRFKTEDSEVVTRSNIQFVKRNQVWYFANFNFLAFPPFLIAVAVVASLVGIVYASGVLFVRARLVSRGKFTGANRFKIFIPLSWRGLLRGN